MSFNRDCDAFIREVRGAARAYDALREAAYYKRFLGAVVPADGDVLAQVNRGSHRIDEIAGELKVSLPYVSIVVKRLHRRSDLKLLDDLYDDRRKVIHLTTQGQEHLTQAMKVDAHVRGEWAKAQQSTMTLCFELLTRIEKFRTRSHPRTGAGSTHAHVTLEHGPIRPKFKSARGASIKAWNRARMEGKASPGIDLGDLELEEDDDVDQG